MNTKNERKHLPLFGIAFFAAEMIFMLTAGGWIQYRFGLWGVAATELCTLGFAFLGALLCRMNPREVFRFTPPPVPKFFASAFMYGGVFFLSLALSSLTMILFPQLPDSSEALVSMIRNTSPAAAVLTVAVLPAICEELFFRGFLSASAKQFPPYLRIAFVGALFGIAHMSLEKFLPMFLLGSFLAYLTLKTNSVFFGILFHFLNNLISVCSVLLSDPEASAAQPSPIVLGGFVMIALSVGAALFFIGYLLFNRIKPKKGPLILLCAACLILYSAGNFSIVQGSTTVAVAETITLTAEQPSYAGSEFTIPPDSTGNRKTVTLSYVISASCPEGSVTVTLQNDAGEVEVWEGSSLLKSGTVSLQPGTYRIVCTYHLPQNPENSATARCDVTVYMSYL